MRDPLVLFISHDASRTGAPIVLLHFLRWLKGNAGLGFEILLGEDGALRSDFEALAPVSVLEAWTGGTRPGDLLARARRRMTLRRVGGRGWDLVYSNTVANGWVLDALRNSPPVITHVHELETAIRYHGGANFEKVKRRTHRYIACAGAVRDNLVKRHGIDGAAVDVVHGFIPASPEDAASYDAASRVRAELGVPSDALIVGAAGTADWRKGADLFVHLGRVVHQQRPAVPIHFVWVGDRKPKTEYGEHVQHDLRALGLESRVHFIGPRERPLDYFRAFDVFALMSREDPFPLVCLEAASVGKPIVCFDGAGGEREFVEDDCGFTVPYLAVELMAERILTLLESQALRERFGRRAAEKVRLRHDVSVVAPRLLAIIAEQIRRTRPATAPRSATS